MFGRASITLGIGPHSSWRCFTGTLLTGGTSLPWVIISHASASTESLCDGPKEACRCVAVGDSGDAECTCDVVGLTCQYGGGSFSCLHEAMICSATVECEKTDEYAEVCADVRDGDVELRIVRLVEPDDAPCATITCRPAARQGASLLRCIFITVFLIIHRLASA